MVTLRERYAVPDYHPIAKIVWGMCQNQSLAERAAVEACRKDRLIYFEKQRARLAADPAATEGDLAVADSCIRATERELGVLPPKEAAARDDRRRQQTRDRCVATAHANGIQ